MMKKFLLVACACLIFVGCTSKENQQLILELENESKLLKEENKNLNTKVRQLESKIKRLEQTNEELITQLKELSVTADETKNQNKEIFTSCTFDKNNDQLILSNENGSYKLSIWLYGKEITAGEYQVFGSDMESVLEGKLLRKGVTVDVKSTLFINCSEDSVKVSGSAQLYKPNSIVKSGEILDFDFDGKLNRQ